MPAFFMFGPESDLFTDFLLHLNEEIRILLHKEVSVMPKLIPELMRKRVTQITLEDLRALSVKGLLLDVDNTLASHGHPDPLDGVTEWLALMRENGVALLLISNNREKRVHDFAARLRLPFVANACKPLPFRIRRAAKRMNLPGIRYCRGGRPGLYRCAGRPRGRNEGDFGGAGGRSGKPVLSHPPQNGRKGGTPVPGAGKDREQEG